MKVALVHDYLIGFGGAERVLAAFCRMFPDAPIYTAIANKRFIKSVPEFSKAKIIASWFAKLPYAQKLLSPLRFLIPLIWGSFNFSKYDLVIVSSAAMIPRGVLTKPPTKTIAYVHTPPRNLYGYEAGSLWQKYKLVRIYGGIINHFLRFYDFTTAQKPDILIANSRFTAARIKKFWRRDSTIAYPPISGWRERRASHRAPGPRIAGEAVGWDELASGPGKKEFYLSVGRLMYAKRVDLIVKTFNQLKKPLIIIGEGEMKNELQKLNKNPHTFFAGFVKDENLSWFYQNAKAFIFAAKDEDFGIVPVEAQSSGLPIVAHASGGTLETVIEGKTGTFFKDHTVKSLTQAISRLDKYLLQGKIKPEACRKNAKQFSEGKFKKAILEVVWKVTNTS